MMEFEIQHFDPGEIGLEGIAENSGENFPVKSEQGILGKIMKLEESGDHFEAASLALRLRDIERGLGDYQKAGEYSDRALANYQKAAEKYRGFVHSRDKLLGDKLDIPNKHEVKIGDYKITAKLCYIEATCKEGDKILIPQVKIKIKGPKFKIIYGYFDGSGVPFNYFELDKVKKHLMENIACKYTSKVNQELLEQLVDEVMMPYQPKEY